MTLPFAICLSGISACANTYLAQSYVQCNYSLPTVHISVNTPFVNGVGVDKHPVDELVNATSKNWSVLTSIAGVG